MPKIQLTVRVVITSKNDASSQHYNTQREYTKLAFTRYCVGATMEGARNDRHTEVEDKLQEATSHRREILVSGKPTSS